MAIFVGGVIKFVVSIDGEPVPTVKWYKDGVSLQTRGNVTIDTDDFTSSLMVKRVTREDRGQYKVVAKNEWGTTEVTFDVSVNGELLTVYTGSVKSTERLPV